MEDTPNRAAWDIGQEKLALVPESAQLFDQ